MTSPPTELLIEQLRLQGGIVAKEIYTKEELKDNLRKICQLGWIPNLRPGNVGGVGNVAEDLLGIKENNLPLPNATEWELKCQRVGHSLRAGSLTTLFHIEPSPTALMFVPKILLPKYGWRHKEAGLKYPETELSFRQTINGLNRSDRGFKIVVDEETRRVLVSFDPDAIAEKHSTWKVMLEGRLGKMGELDPQPYWGFDLLFSKAGIKLLNCFYIQALTRKNQGQEEFKYISILMLSKFSPERFLAALTQGYILVDFDARTGHNHGTKFRLPAEKLPTLYNEVEIVEINPEAAVSPTVF